MTEIILILGAALTSTIAVVLGGATFWQVPIFQFVFPGIGFGVMMGNMRVGSMLRGFASLYTTRKQVNYKNVLLLSPPLLIGTAIGANFISSLDSKWGLLIIALAALISECSEYLSQRIGRTTYQLSALVLGIYYGLFGAGLGILLVSLIRIKFPQDSNIAKIKSDARAVELIMSIIAVLAHFLSGNLISSTWIPWSIGAIIGGLIGGSLLNHMSKMSNAFQKGILRFSYALSLIGTYIKS